MSTGDPVYPRLSMAEFCDTAAEVLAELPQPFHDWLENVVIDVEPVASPRRLAELGVADHHHPPLGLFVGRPLTEQAYGERAPNRILLFKDTIESICRSADEVRYEIRRTVIHELAHHFGYEEHELEDFEARRSPFDRRGGH